jgi:hypothetical protein
MNDHESIHALGEFQTEPRTRPRARARITVRSSEAKPYDQTASPTLVEIHLSETFTEISMANHRFGLYRSYATIILQPRQRATIRRKTGRRPGHFQFRVVRQPESVRQIRKGKSASRL